MSGRGTRETRESGGAAEAPGDVARAPTASADEKESVSVESVLSSLAGPRLRDLCRLFGCEVHDISGGKDGFVRKLAAQLADRLVVVLKELGRDELRAVCRRHGLDASPRARADLQATVLLAAGLDPRAASERPPTAGADGLPGKGQIVHARHRQWLVDDVQRGEGDESPLVRLICLDDDDPGRVIEVLWSLELGARVIAPEQQGIGSPSKLDPPSHFGAYLHALKWSAVSAADATLFQAPFRAGIKLMAHQLTPLMKALELPRANLFIADDVGLGKTIEAGLVLQELLLRQQANFVLVVSPASVCLQWQVEMQRRFGLRFEVMTRQFVAYRRQERGFGTNPWSTNNRFIISHTLLRRPEYRDALLHHLGDRARKGHLILDEAHVAAPASASKYATDTDITRTIRDLAPRFDNRLFLSATPHNGHSNSFSALLEILDPVRFTRGVPVEGKKDLEPIMVRRLKRDLRKLGVEKFPKRLLVQLALNNKDKRWTLERTPYDAETGVLEAKTSADLGPGEPIELTLSEKLQRYTDLCAPTSGLGRFLLVCLQQRGCSPVPGGLRTRTLQAHAQGLEKRGGPIAAPEQKKLALAPRIVPDREDADPELFGLSDEAQAEEEDADVRRTSSALGSPTDEARQLLSDMRALAEKARRAPDAKARALFAWLRENLCPALGLGEDTNASRAWSPKRVILFTEYADTKRYLVELLTAATAYTDKAEQRIRQFHGGMGDDARDDVQRASNSELQKTTPFGSSSRRTPHARASISRPTARTFSTSTSHGTPPGSSSATGASTARSSRPTRSDATTSSIQTERRTRSSRPSSGRSRRSSVSSGRSEPSCSGSSRRRSRTASPRRRRRPSKPSVRTPSRRRSMQSSRPVATISRASVPRSSAQGADSRARVGSWRSIRSRFAASSTSAFGSPGRAHSRRATRRATTARPSSCRRSIGRGR